MQARKLWLTALALLALCQTACSPFFVVQAGWEEASILLGREDIHKLLKDPSLDEKLKHKFELVLEARKYADQLGLKPKGSFTQYSDVGRKVLVWVLSAAPKDSLSPVTWWFPIVGTIPYKGYFEKEDAKEAFDKLKEKDFDVYLRTSAAFSTLGWFDDPLLSTMLGADDISLVGTVIHEVLHNTLWIKDHAEFNETLANFVGSVGARDFFALRDLEQARKGQDRWHDQLLFARFLDELHDRLETLYENEDEKLSREQIIEQRENIFSEAKHRWLLQKDTLRSKGFQRLSSKLNNAVLVAQRIYLLKPWVFVELFETCDESLPRFIEQMKLIGQEVNDSGDDPYDVVQKHTAKLRELASNPA